MVNAAITANSPSAVRFGQQKHVGRGGVNMLLWLKYIHVLSKVSIDYFVWLFASSQIQSSPQVHQVPKKTYIKKASWENFLTETLRIPPLKLRLRNFHQQETRVELCDQYNALLALCICGDKWCDFMSFKSPTFNSLEVKGAERKKCYNHPWSHLNLILTNMTLHDATFVWVWLFHRGFIWDSRLIKSSELGDKVQRKALINELVLAVALQRLPG